MSEALEPDGADDVDAQLRTLFDKVSEFDKQCLHVSAMRVAREVQRLAKREQRVVQYLWANHYIMNIARGLLDGEVCRDAAIDSIALLESEDRARALQPDFPQEDYDATVAWGSTCAYDNLASATAMLNGYNSPGTHDCIGEGLQVCRRTGKLRCIACFREYAAGVYEAADDLEMALHYARSAARMAPSEENDRRWVGARTEASILLLQGQVEASIEAFERAIELCDTFHTPRDSWLETLARFEQALWLAGQGPAIEKYRAKATVDLSPLPAGEFPAQEMHSAQCEAVRACCQGEYPRAIECLTALDRQLTERKCLSDWFECRLRLVAVERLAGNLPRAQALAKPLEQKARAARDWLSLRRLKRLLDPEQAASPVAAVAAMTIGPYAAAPSAVSAGVETSAAQQQSAENPAPTEAADGDEPETPLGPQLDVLRSKLREHPDDIAAANAVWSELAGIPLEQVTDLRDGVQMVYAAQYLRHLLSNAALETAESQDASDEDKALAAGQVSQRNADLWQWAEKLAARFPQDATMLSMLADLGDTLRTDPHFPHEGIDDTRIEKLFSQSLDLDPEHVGNHARAGGYYLSIGNLGEAERTLARGFRLDRTNSFLALRLSETYTRTDRPRDGLEVLDMCLREGCDDPQVLWEAGLLAHRLGRFEALVTYLDKFEQTTPGERWTHYYRTVGLLETERPQLALEALELERARTPLGQDFHLLALSAAAHGLLGDAAEFERRLQETLAQPLVQVDYLSRQGLFSLFERLWRVSEPLALSDDLRSRFTRALVAAGFTSDDLFEKVRKQAPMAEGIRLYRVELEQPLDGSWPKSPGCLFGQEGWRAFRMGWGVLAASEDDAERHAREWQSQAYPQAARLLAIDVEEGVYRDSPGVVWQTMPQPADDESE